MSARKPFRKTPASEIEMKRLIDLVEAGLTIEQIAERLALSPQVIAEELARAALRPNRPPWAGRDPWWPLQ